MATRTTRASASCPGEWLATTSKKTRVNHQPKEVMRRPTNWLATPRITAKEGIGGSKHGPPTLWHGHGCGIDDIHDQGASGLQGWKSVTFGIQRLENRTIWIVDIVAIFTGRLMLGSTVEFHSPFIAVLQSSLSGVCIKHLVGDFICCCWCGRCSLLENGLRAWCAGPCCFFSLIFMIKILLHRFIEECWTLKIWVPLKMHNYYYVGCVFLEELPICRVLPICWRANITSGICRQDILDRNSIVLSIVKTRFYSSTSPRIWEPRRCWHVESLFRFDDWMHLPCFPRRVTWGPQRTSGSHCRTASTQSAWRTPCPSPTALGG